MKQLEIGSTVIGDGCSTFIIAEVAQAHDGSLGMAHSYIDAAAEAGVDAIKFQTHIASEESSLDEEFRIKFSKQDATRYDYWKRMEFTREQWAGLRDHAVEAGLVFLSTPFSVAAVELLEALDVPAWKMGSGEVFNDILFSAVAGTGKPVLLSTGMSSWQDMEAAVSQLEKNSLEYALFQCTSSYPVALEKVGLNVIDDMRQRFGCPVGLSDHSGQIYPGLAALSRGADILEAHIVMDRRCFGPDTPASLTPDQFELLSRARDAFTIMDMNPVDKDAMASEMQGMRQLFTKSVALRRDVEAGTVLTEALLTGKKPGTGIPVEKLPELIGKKVVRPVKHNRLLQLEDIDGS